MKGRLRFHLNYARIIQIKGALTDQENNLWITIKAYIHSLRCEQTSIKVICDLRSEFPI